MQKPDYSRQVIHKTKYLGVGKFVTKKVGGFATLNKKLFQTKTLPRYKRVTTMTNNFKPVIMPFPVMMPCLLLS